MSPLVFLVFFLLCSFTFGAVIGKCFQSWSGSGQIPKRFNLKSLLAIMTAVALSLGTLPFISDWANRRNAIRQVRWAFADLRQPTNPFDFHFIRYQERTWIISSHSSRFVDDGFYLGDGPLPGDEGKLWVSPPGRWIKDVDEAVTLIESDL